MADQLSGLDAAFLEAETDTVHLHALGVVRLAPGERALTPADLHDLVDRRLDRLHPLRHRLVTVPGGLDQPYWTHTVPDLSQHLHHVVLRGEGHHEFESFCAGLARQHLDRTLPLWQFWLVDGLADHAQALVMKVHHSLSDGIGGLAIVAGLLDVEPDPPSQAPLEAIDGEAAPGAAWMLARAAGHVARWPLEAARTVGELGGSALRLGRVLRRSPAQDRAAPLATPRLASSGRISAARATALRDLPLDRVKAVARAADVRVNDVVLATLAGALRAWLEAHDDLPDQPLVAAVPVSTRGADQLAEPGNHVSACFVHLATHVDDAAQRLRTTAASTIQAKSAHAAVGDAALAHFTSLVLPITVVSALRLYSGLGLPALHPPAVNLVVSNVPGPTFPLYLAGRRVDRLYALGPIFDGAPLNVTVVSYDGTLGFGLLACPDRFADLDALADEIGEGFEELATAVGV